MEAGALVRGFYESGVETEYKGEADLVTEADRASERLIVERSTAAAFPSHGVYGEEGTRGQMESEYRWYIDPGRWDDEFCPSLSSLLRLHGIGISRLHTYPPTKMARLWPASSTIRRGMSSSLQKRGKAPTSMGGESRYRAPSWWPKVLLATGFPSRKRHQNPNIHFYQEITHALARGAARWLGRTRSRVHGLRALRWILGSSI